MRPLLALLLLLAVVLAGCSATPQSLIAADVQPKPTPTPTPTPTPPPTPQPLPQADPFDVALTAVRVRSVDNGVLYGVPAQVPDPAAAQAGAEQAVAALEHFLYSQFVSRSSLLSDAGLSSLIDPASADPGTRAALGVLDRDDVLGTRSGAASAEADVLIDGTTVEAVTLTYTATLELVLEEAEGPVVQTGVLVMSPVQGTMRPAAWQPVTTFGDDLAGVLS